MSAFRPSPFHVRMAERNPANAWLARGAFTLPAHYRRSAWQETLAARLLAVMVGCFRNGALRSARCRRGQAALGRLRPDIDAIASGNSSVFCGAAKAAACVAWVWQRVLAPANFTLVALDIDGAWFESSRQAFRCHRARRDEREGAASSHCRPLASAILSCGGGLDHAARLEPGCHAVLWRGLQSRCRAGALCQALGGYEIACANDDAVTGFRSPVACGRRSRP